MKPDLYQLYARLADGELHSGAPLADEFGISRAAVWKRVQALRDMGLTIPATAGDGYRLERPIELLDAEDIRSQTGAAELVVSIAGAVDSTNARLAKAGGRHGHALLAEAQTAGRGRRGRGWQSPPGSGLYLSLAWHFESGLAGLAPLSLVVGLSAAETLRQIGGAPVTVKWPNDLFIDDRKLGGCLVEMSGAAEGPCRAVVGVGINLFATPAIERVDQAWTALADHGEPVSRNRLAGRLLDALASALAHFDRRGFDDFLVRWPAFDALGDRPVRVIHANGSETQGTARGIDGQGRLVLETGDSRRAIASGEVSVRVR